VHHVEHQPAVRMRGVDDQHVDARVHESHRPRPRIVADADGRADQEAARARGPGAPPAPTAAPTSGLPSLSLVDSGNFSVLTKSLTVISPVSLPCPSTIGNFSILWRRNRPSAASADTPACAVISGALVITSETGLDLSNSKRTSRVGVTATQSA